MKAALVLLAVLLVPTEPRDHYPPRLRSVFDSSRATTGQVEWTVSWIGGRDAGLVERYVTRQAGDAVWESNLGDENGYHPTGYSADRDDPSEKNPPEPGTPKLELPDVIDEEWLREHELPKERLAGTRNSLISDGQAWYLPYAEKPLSGDVNPLETAQSWLPVDLPRIGLAPYWLHDLDANAFHLPNRSFEGFDSASFREGTENGLPTLSAEWVGSSRLTWRFDDRYGGKPVWAAFERDGVPVYSSETEYERIGERWFPKSVGFYQGDSASLYKIIDVQRATFDEPWQMQEITPNDIGAINGTSFAGPDQMKVWTGAELVSIDEFNELMEIYDVPEDRRITELRVGRENMEKHELWWRDYLARRREEYRKKHGEEPWLVKKSPKEKDEWDVYVEKFLTEHKLPEPGVKRATEVRDQAKKLRDAYRRKNAAALKKAKAENDSRKVAEYEGIEKRIFDRVLVRDLKRLAQDEKNSPKKEP